jgi:hypothetical protein
VIHRFSEDIDLAFDRGDLGFGGDRDPGVQPTGKKRRRELDALSQVTREYVQGEFADRLRNAIADALGAPEGEGWRLEPDPQDTDGQSLLFEYPKLPLNRSRINTRSSYIREQIKLELGSRSEQDPAERQGVRPYAAEALPDVFVDPWTEVQVLAIERTFWEKATILHQEAHRPVNQLRKHHSRHYFDLVMIADSDYRERCYQRVDLLAQVADHKSRFFPQAWARYDLARDPATLRLVPNDALRHELSNDYGEMRTVMFAGDTPTVEYLMDRLQQIEAEIRQLSVSAGGG